MYDGLPIKNLFLTVLAMLLAFAQLTYGQQVKYDFFDKSPLGGIRVNPPLPAGFENYSNRNTITPSKPIATFPSLLLYSSSIGEQNQKHYEEAERLIAAGNEKELSVNLSVKNDLIEAGFIKYYPPEVQLYRQTFDILSKFNADSFSLAAAIFLVENAYNNNGFSFEEFKGAIQQRAEHVKQLLEKEGLNTKNNVALNYGIQKLFAQSNPYYSTKTKQTITIPAVKYDFNDYRGEKDYRQMFVSKILYEGKGQCHSMPLLYLLLAEQLGAKAWLSMAPQHSFIQFKDATGKLVNFETTNGRLVSNTWLMQSGFITAKALKNKTFLDTLSKRRLYAQSLADLMLGYMQKFGYDDFAEQIRQKVLQINPDNLTALMVDANRKTQEAIEKIRAAGKPKPEDLQNYPEAYKAYLAMKAAQDKVNNTGYQDMPETAYQRWLKSMEQEKKKQKNKELQEKLKRQIESQKKPKVTFINLNPNS